MIRPVFVFDSNERWFPVGVEESLKATKATVPRYFAGAEDSQRFQRGGNVDFPRNMRQPNLPPVVYHRRVTGGPLVWDQFWLWYVYNPWAVAGVGRHEGDWEFVQIGCTPDAESLGMDDGTPVLVTCSQHRTGGKREAWVCEQATTAEGRPVVYVARDSHAMYFAPGRHNLDVCDGKGKRLTDYEVREFGPWHSWPGRWGNSTGEGKSPESPGCQGIRWNAPHLFHAQAEAQ